MTDHSSCSNLSELAALRVQHWLGINPKMPALLDQPTPKEQEFRKRHQCAPVRFPRTLSLIDQLSIQELAPAKKRARQITRDCGTKPLGITVDQPYSIHKRDLQFFQLENPLSAAGIFCFHKEHLFASRRLKNLSRQRSQEPKRHQIAIIRSSSTEELVSPEQWNRFREERQFQISRM